MASEQTTKKILVVDDQENWRKALTSLLEDHESSVASAQDFETATALLAQGAFDLVVLDVRLVDQDKFNAEGLDLLHHIRATSPATKTVILTGYPESVHEKPDVDAYIFKVPSGSHFDSRAFKRRIKELLQ